MILERHFRKFDIKNVLGAASSQEQLASAAQNAVSTIIQLADVVKFGAASLGANNPEAQVGINIYIYIALNNYNNLSVFLIMVTNNNNKWFSLRLNCILLCCWLGVITLIIVIDYNFIDTT